MQLEIDLTKKPKIKTTKQCLEIISDTMSATSFSNDSNTITPNSEGVYSISFSCRDNGDIGEETPGQEDIKEAKELKKILNEKFKNEKTAFILKASLDYVDEWTHLEITLTPKTLIEKKLKSYKIFEEAVKNIPIHGSKFKQESLTKYVADLKITRFYVTLDLKEKSVRFSFYPGQFHTKLYFKEITDISKRIERVSNETRGFTFFGNLLFKKAIGYGYQARYNKTVDKPEDAEITQWTNQVLTHPYGLLTWDFETDKEKPVFLTTKPKLIRNSDNPQAVELKETDPWQFWSGNSGTIEAFKNRIIYIHPYVNDELAQKMFNAFQK
jgi:hypothetical protein